MGLKTMSEETIHLEDMELVEKAKAGDFHALDQLIQKIYPEIYAYCLHFWGDRSKAEDTTQDIAIKIIQNLHRYKPRSAFRAWVFRIAFNHVRQRYRYEKIRRWIPLSVIGEPEHSGYDPIRDIEIGEKFAWLKQGLTKLSDRERTAILLRAIHGLSYEEIAEVMNCSLAQVKNYLFRGRKSLQNQWREQQRLKPAGEAHHEPIM